MKEDNEMTLLTSYYVDENVSVKVTKIIQSYGNIVAKFKWRKE